MSRPSLQSISMSVAWLWSLRSTCSRRVAVGAVLTTKDGRTIATGYNGSPAGEPHCNDVGCLLDDNGHCTRAIHAEENVLIQCAIHGVSSRGKILYVTHTPCFRCCGKIIQAEIAEVYYSQNYGDEKTVAANVARLRAAGVICEHRADLRPIQTD